jgi:prepilin-type N-terminal cleavage/methylation domain-containing protein
MAGLLLFRRLVISPRKARTPQRGFTIIELLMVMSIIGILVAAASPSFVRWMKDKRVTDAAANIADLYRMARARAMGRGAATAVVWNQSVALPNTANPGGHFVIREAVTRFPLGLGAPGGEVLLAPLANCRQPDNDGNNSGWRFVSGFDERRKRYEPAEATFLETTGTTRGYAEICYTPRGRVFYRISPAGAFGPFTAVPRVQVENKKDGMKRHVILTPTGAARVVMRIP